MTTQRHVAGHATTLTWGTSLTGGASALAVNDRLAQVDQKEHFFASFLLYRSRETCMDIIKARCRSSSLALSHSFKPPRTELHRESMLPVSSAVSSGSAAEWVRLLALCTCARALPPRPSPPLHSVSCKSSTQHLSLRVASADGVDVQRCRRCRHCTV